MGRKASLLVFVVGATATGFMLFGPPLSRDGSGIWPRFLSDDANYDALEVHRARQGLEASTSPPISNEVPGTKVLPAGPPTEPVTTPTTPAETSSTSLLPTAVTEPATASGYWPDFRGSLRDGRYRETPILTSWPREGLRLLWKQPIGLGYASFVIADGRAFTIEQRREQEVVTAYEVETGRELWAHGWDAEFVEFQGGNGPRATPTYHEGRIYALGALGELRALDAASGALQWRRNILIDNDVSNLDWGMSAAPLVVDEKVIVLPGGRRGRSVVAYDASTGEEVWTSLDDRQAYTSPMMVTLGGVSQILVVSAERAMGLTVDEGRLLWKYPWVTQFGINAAQPLLLGNDRVFLSASYGHGAAVFEVTRQGEDFAVQTVWQNNRMKNKFTSSVLHDGYIYGLDEAILACVDAATGELQWKGGRYGYGQILLAGEHLVVLTEDGDLALVSVTPDRHVELARFPAIDGRTWNHPVIAGGLLLVRNLREMAAFNLRP